MQAQLSEGGRFLGKILIEPTCSTSLACCAISFIRLTRAVPLGSNFALGLGAFSNVLAMIIPCWIASSVPDGTFNVDHLENATGTAVCDTPCWETRLQRKLHFRENAASAALRPTADTTSI